MERTKKVLPKNNQSQQRLALEALGSEGFLCVNKKLLSHFGPNLAIYIGNLVDKFKYFRDKGWLQDDQSFFLRQNDQVVHTGMSEYQLRKCKTKLKSMKILRTQMREIPPKEFYILDFDVLVAEFLMNIPLVFRGMEVKKLEECTSKNFRNNKETVNKEIKEKENKLLLRGGNGKITPSQFTQFWELYPKKAGSKGNAKKIWERLCSSKNGKRPEWRTIRKAIHEQKKTEQWQDKKYIPHPTTWLNQERWIDDPESMNQIPRNNSAKVKWSIGLDGANIPTDN